MSGLKTQCLVDPGIELVDHYRGLARVTFEVELRISLMLGIERKLRVCMYCPMKQSSW